MSLIRFVLVVSCLVSPFALQARDCDVISYCGPSCCNAKISLPKYRWGCGPSPFCGPYIGLGVGGDYNQWNERQLDVFVVPPADYTSNFGSGSGFLTEAHIGWGVPLWLAYLGGRLGYHAFWGDGTYLLTHSTVEFVELHKRQGVFVDFTPGFFPLRQLLANLIIGAECNSYLMIGHNNQGVFRDQHEWGWSLRLGAGLQWAWAKNWAIGVDYVHSFPGNVTWPGPKQGPNLLDQNVRTVQAKSNQATLTLNYYLAPRKRWFGKREPRDKIVRIDVWQ